MKQHNPTEYTQITPYIYVGTNMCCGVHFMKLRKLGISAEISLEERQTEEPEGMDTYLWLPTIDKTPPSQTQLRVGAQCIDALVKSRKKVYIHCMNGHGRGPTLAMAYFIHAGSSFDEAFAQVESKRPEIHLEPSQKRALKIFEKSVKSEKLSV